MKKIILITFLISISQIIFSQNNKSENQKFKIQFFKISNTSDIKDLVGLNISFDIILSNPLENYYNFPYNLFVELKDTANNTVYKTEKSVAEIFAKKSFTNPKECEPSYVKFYIPFSEINSSVGEQKYTLIIKAKSQSKDFNEIFNYKVLINKPKMFDNTEQKFNITKFSAQQIKKYQVKGLDINFSYSLKFDVSQIKNIESNSKLGEYYFAVKLFNKNDNTPIQVFTKSTSIKSITPTKKTGTAEIFIPLNDINLSQGKHDIYINLFAVTSLGNYNFGKLFSDTLNLIQEKLYIFNFTLSKCNIADNEYDISSEIGRLFSSASSNKGKGYPDVYWKLNTGNITKFFSKTYKNQLYAPTGNTMFIITESDPIKFSVMDYDITSFDDFIGGKSIKNINGTFSKKFESYSSGGIISSNFKYSKTNLPSLKKSNITNKLTKQEGVTGYISSLTYKFNDLPKNSNLSVKPIYTKNSETKYLNYESLPAKETNFKIFIPIINIPRNCKIGYEIKDNKFINKQIFSEHNIKTPEINDIIPKIESVKEELNLVSKTYGLRVTILWDIPFFYKKNSDNIYSILSIYKNNTKILDTTITNLKELTNNKINLFIPYYKLSDYSKAINFIITDTSKILNYIVGSTKLNFKANLPKIESLNLKKAIIYLKKFDSTDKYFIQIYHDKKCIYISPKVKATKKITFENLKPNLLFNKNDKIRISINKENKFGLPSIIDSKEFYGEDFINKKKLKIKGIKPLYKKAYLFF